MPFAKAVFRRSDGRAKGNEIGVEVSGGRHQSPGQFFHESLVGISRQLSALLLHADRLFDELITEYRLIGDRSDRLKKRIDGVSIAVGHLDAKAVSIPEGTIHTVAQVGRHFEVDYTYRGLSIFDPSNRPLLVQELYSKAAPTPIGHIRECDCYRTDNIRGAQIFSRVVFAINKWADDFNPVGNTQTKHKAAFSPKAHRIRPLPTSIDTSSQENTLVGSNNGINGKRTEVFDDEEDSFPPSSDLQAVLVVDIDITGTSFNKLCKLHERLQLFQTKDESYPTASLSRYKKSLKRPKTISGISDLVFQEVDIDFPLSKHGGSVKGIHRRSLKKLNSQTLEIYAPSEKRKSLKKKTNRYFDEDDSKSCNSIRQSLKSVFRLSRSKSKDLWNPRSTEEATNKSEVPSFSLRRSVSLPRSLKSSTKQSTASFGSFRSSSVEGRLNLRVLPTDPLNANRILDSNLPKPVAGERLGRSLTKSLSQMRLGHSSKGCRNFGVPGRPQSMEIRIPQFDEEGRNISSLYNSSSIIVSSSATVTSSGTGDQSWSKSDVKFRHLDNKDCKDDCQSSSGRWSGSSGLTEKQLQDSERQSGSMLVVQSSSEMSFNTKDSAMCLHFSPSENESSPQKRKIIKQDIFLHQNTGRQMKTAANGVEDKSSTAAVKQFFEFSDATSEHKNSPGNETRTHQHQNAYSYHDEIDDDENFPNKFADRSKSFNRAANSNSSAKSKSSYRSSFMLKLRRFGKSSKSEVSNNSPKSPVSRSSSTMGDYISMSNELNSQSLTPCLPRAHSNELKKLAELADRMANARVKTQVNVPGSYPLCSKSVSYGSPMAQNSDVHKHKSLDCQSVPFEETDRIRHSNALNMLPLEVLNSGCQESLSSNLTKNGNIRDASNSLSAGPDLVVSTSKPDPRTVAKGQKLVELESILETSHDCEMNSPFTVRSKLSASSRSRLNKPDSSKHSLSSDDQNSAEMGSPAVSSSLEDLDESKMEYDQSNKKDTELIGTDSDRYSGTEVSTSESSIISVLPLPVDTKNDALDCQIGPVPATARLIISSPVASHAFFVENPHKRSVCQALSSEEFAKFCTGDMKAGESPLKKESHFVFPEKPSLSKQSLDFSRHSSGFSVTIRERVDPSNYGRSWYDGISDELLPAETKVSPPSSVLPFALPTKISMQSNMRTSNNSGLAHGAKDRYLSHYTSLPSKNSVSADGSRIRPNNSVIATRAGKSAPEKKCARVMFPSPEAGQLPQVSLCQISKGSSPSKHNSSHKPFSNVNVLNLKTFGSNLLVDNMPKNRNSVLHNGGTLNLKKPFLPYEAQVLKSSTLPRSYSYNLGVR